MEPRFFSILGLSPTRERDRSGLNDPESHRDDEHWRLGDVSDAFVAAFQASTGASPAGTVTAGVRPTARESSCDAVASAS